jgi:hypothetical protein
LQHDKHYIAGTILLASYGLRRAEIERDTYLLYGWKGGWMDGWMDGYRNGCPII